MTRIFSTTGLLIATLVLTISSMAGAQIDVDDPGVREIKISGDFVFLSEAPVETIEGTVSGATGHVTTDTTDLTQTRGTISVPVIGMKTGNKKRDKHVASKVWLDAKTYPEIKFELASVKVGNLDNGSEVKMAQLEATGQFSLHGVSQEMTIPLTLKWKEDAVKVTAEFDVALRDFDVKGAKGIVGERVGESIKLNATLTGNVQ